MRFLALTAALFITPAALVSQEVDTRGVAAVNAAVNDGWDIGMAVAEDAVTRDVILWLQLRKGEAEFEGYGGFVNRRTDWPSMERVRAAGEEMMPEGLNPQFVLGWFGDAIPDSGEGAARLAEALFATGQDPRQRRFWSRFGRLTACPRLATTRCWPLTQRFWRRFMWRAPTSFCGLGARQRPSGCLTFWTRIRWL